MLFAFDKIEEAGHEALLIDAQNDGLNTAEAKSRVDAFAPDFLVIPTAPSYLFWRCPPPEVRIPKQWFAELGGKAVKVAIGPHTSATPAAAMPPSPTISSLLAALGGRSNIKAVELAAKAARGGILFQDGAKGNCYDCHGEDATGIDALGSTNLTRKDLYLYGADRASILESIVHGRRGVMPDFDGKLKPGLRHARWEIKIRFEGKSFG